MTAWKIASIVVLTAANAFFVAAEFGLVTVRRTRVKELVAAGNRRAVSTQKAINQLSLMLSGTQLGVTLTALGMGALGEPALAHALYSALDSLPSPERSIATHAVAGVIAFILITFFDVVVGEMVPKNLALSRPEGIALAVSTPLRGFAAALRPLIWLIQSSASKVLRWIGINPGAMSSAHTPGELALIVEESRRKGSIEPAQSDLLTRSLEFPDRRAVEAMVPRVSVQAVPAAAKLADVLELAEVTGYSRFPVWRERPDEFVGWVHLKDMLRIAKRRPEATAGEAMRSPLLIPDSLPLDEVLVLMRRNRAHMAIVLDEFGATAGIITLEDILEELVGEIRDESDAGDAAPRRIAGGLRVSGTLRPDELEDATGLKLPDGDYETVAGFILSRLGRLARRGDEVTISDWTLRVAQLGRRRILLVDVRPPPKPVAPAAGAEAERG
ncbi:MAG TPA: hemolysin family protein [Actinomycetota bacterium]|nr:hemolysin family protein [Actinomycetota bacterium]